MTTLARDLLEAIDRLPEADQLSLVAEILRRTSHLDLPQLREEVLVSAADELFLELDAREAADAHP